MNSTEVPPFTYQMFSLFHFLFNTDFFFNSWKDCVVSFKPVPFGVLPHSFGRKHIKNYYHWWTMFWTCAQWQINELTQGQGLGIHRAGRETWCSHHRHVLIIPVLNPRDPKQITVTLLHPHPSPWVGLGWEGVKDLAGLSRHSPGG